MTDLITLLYSLDSGFFAGVSVVVTLALLGVAARVCIFEQLIGANELSTITHSNAGHGSRWKKSARRQLRNSEPVGYSTLRIRISR